jgi:hypothetical protein
LSYHHVSTWKPCEFSCRFRLVSSKPCGSKQRLSLLGRRTKDAALCSLCLIVGHWACLRNFTYQFVDGSSDRFKRPVNGSFLVH